MLEERGERGGSYAMIHRYLADGDPQPPTGFLLVAAQLLGVRAEWLLEGKGERTEAEHRAGDVLKEVTGEEGDRFLVLGDLGGWSGGNLAVGALMIDATVALIGADPSGREPSRDEVEALDRILKRLLIQPLSVLQCSEPSREEARRYFVAAAHALNLAIPSRGRGRPIADIVAEHEEEAADE